MLGTILSVRSGLRDKFICGTIAGSTIAKGRNKVAKIYFAHPVNTYGTELEKELYFRINEAFPRHVIINPNKPQHQDGYKRWRDETGKGMSYFYEEVLPKCKGIVLLAFRDGKFGAGVVGEARFMIKRGHLMWEISLQGELSRLYDIPKERTLSIEETRLRLRDGDGNTLPY